MVQVTYQAMHLRHQMYPWPIGLVDVKPLNKSESGNSQTIIIMYGVGFETNAGMKVSVVR